MSSITANVTISNEGTSGYEYQYEWCVVSEEDNACGGGDDVFYSSAAKYIQTGEDWTTNLNATVSNTGSYWFKVVVYYGTETSGASQTFTAVEEEEEEQPSGGGGGGIIPSKPEEVPIECWGADLNKDGKVSLIDFSILLYWWDKLPFVDPCIDINQDDNVNLPDFSIMLYHWTG